MKQFDRSSHNLPSDFSWLEMENGIWKKVDRRKRKRRFLLLFFFAFLGSSIAWGVWIMLVNPSANETVIVSKSTHPIVNETCLINEYYSLKTEDNSRKPFTPLEVQPFINQQIKPNSITAIASNPLPELIAIPKIEFRNPISKLQTPIDLLSSPVSPLVAPKIILEKPNTWKRITIHSGINSYESNIKNQIPNEVILENSTNTQVGMQVNLRYEWNAKKENKYWGISMNYTRLHSRFEYYSEREIIVTRDLYLSPWELLLPREYLEQLYRQVQIKAIEKRRVIHNNSQNLIDFSVYKGMQKQWKVLDLYANLGGRFNLVHWANGKVADASGEVILLEDMEYYKWNVGASLLLEGGFRYPINKQLDFSGQFGLQQSLNDWIRESQLVQQKPRVYWLNFGVSYGME